MIKKPNILVFAVVLTWFFGFQVSLAAETLFSVDSSTVALWRFNDAPGSFVKDETGVNHGTAFGTTVVDGKFGKAREFNGSGQYVEVPNNSSLNNLSQITIEAWIYPTGFDLSCWNNNESIVGKGPGDAINALSLRLWRNNDDGCSGANSFRGFYPSGNFGNGVVSTSTMYAPNEWIYITFSYDGESMKLFVNGNIVSTGSFSGLSVNNSNSLFINKHFWASGFSQGRMAGLIDEIRISNKARSAAEIKNNYERGTGLKKKNPVLIIPGLMGTWFSRLDPIKGTYNNLIKNLKNKGYSEQELFTFPYDWRNDNEVSANYLAEKMEEIKKVCNCDKVDLVAHSMGGLIARSYIASDNYKNDVGQLIFLGTPHLGSPDAYSIWEAGEEEILRDTLREKLLDIWAIPTGKSRFDFIRDEIKSIQQLLPVFSYLRKDGQNIEYPLGYPKNDFLDSERLNSLASINNLSARTDKLVNVTGNLGPNSTIRYINVQTRNDLAPKWEHGYPVSLEKSKGDGVVPHDSIIPVDEEIEVISKHGSLPTYAWSAIAKFFAGEDRPVPMPEDYGTLLIAVHSPVDFYVIDPNGQKVGSVNGVPTEQIEGSFYSGSGNPELEFVTIPNPLPGEYKVVTRGTGDGKYDIEANFFDENDAGYASGTFTANTKTNLEEELNFNFEDSNVVDIEPKDLIAPSTTANVSGQKGSNGWFVSDATISLNASDEGVGVFKTEYSLDDGRTWINYMEPITLGEGRHVVNFRSEDFVGNREDVKRIGVNVDKSAPEASFYWDKVSKNLRIEGLDMSSTTILRDKRGFLIKDEAGHTTEISMPKFHREGKEIKGKLASISYNKNSPIPAIASFKYEWSEGKDGAIKNLEQKTSYSVNRNFPMPTTASSKDERSEEDDDYDEENSKRKASYFMKTISVKFNKGISFIRVEDQKKKEVKGLVILNIVSDKGKFLVKF